MIRKTLSSNQFLRVGKVFTELRRQVSPQMLNCSFKAGSVKPRIEFPGGKKVLFVLVLYTFDSSGSDHRLCDSSSVDVMCDTFSWLQRRFADGTIPQN